MGKGRLFLRALSVMLALAIAMPILGAFAEGEGIPAVLEEAQITQAPSPVAAAEVPQETKAPESTAVPTATPESETTTAPTATPELEATAVPTATPEAEATTAPTDTALPEQTLEATNQPDASLLTMSTMPVPSVSPEASADSEETPCADFVLEGEKLVSYIGAGGDVVIPEGVSVIGTGAFANCATLTGLTLSSTVVEIEENAFAGCNALVYIRFPASLETIAELDSLLAAAPQVRIEVSEGSHAHLYCQSKNIACVCFDAPQPSVVIPEKIVLSADSLVLGLKEQVSLADWTLLPEGAQDTMQYASKSTKIASVNSEGVVTAKRAGSTSILLTSGTGLKAEVKITVKRAPSSVSVSAPRKTMGQGGEPSAELYAFQEERGSCAL